MNTTFYFRHDYNSRSNEKLLKLQRQWGWEGYGLYWAIIEKMYEAGGELELDYETIAFDLRTNNDCIEAIISGYDLFEIKENVFTSKRVRIELGERMTKSDKARKSVEARWGKKKKGVTNVLRTQCDSNTKEERRGEDTKGKDISKSHSRFKSPTIEEVESLFLEKQSTKEEAFSFWNFYESKGWMVGKNKMKNWKSAVVGWISRNKTNNTNKTNYDY